MTRVTGYKCIFQTNDERFKFALTLAGGDGEGDFVVANADAVETLLDMFEDSSEAHFDAESGELTFAFDALKIEEEGEREDDGEEEGEGEGDEDEESDADDDTEEHASSEEASLEAEEDEEETPPSKKKSRRSAA